MLIKFSKAIEQNDITACNEIRTQLHDHLKNPVYHTDPPFYNFLFDRAQHNVDSKLLNAIADDIIAPINWDMERISFLSSTIKQVISPENLAVIPMGGDLTTDPVQAALRVACISGSAKSGGGNNKIYIVTFIDNDKMQIIINSSLMPEEGLAALKILKDEKCPYLIQTYSEISLPSTESMSPDMHAVVRVMDKAQDMQKIAKEMADRSDNDKERQIALHSNNMIDCILWLRDKNIFFPDMKISNMFVNSEGQLVLPDLKTLTPYSVQALDNEGNKIIKRGMFDSSRPYEPPEIRGAIQKTYNVNSYESYCIGLNMYILATGHHPAKDVSDSDLRTGVKLPFTFDHPVFNSPSGLILKDIIVRLVDGDPRLQLNEARKLLASYEEKIGIKADENKSIDATAAVSSTASMLTIMPRGQQRTQPSLDQPQPAQDRIPSVSADKVSGPVVSREASAKEAPAKDVEVEQPRMRR